MWSLHRLRPGLSRQTGGGRVLRLTSTCSRTSHRSTESSAIVSDQAHLQRSLDLGPAYKQAPEFEYVAVAFRSEPRLAKRSKVQRRRGGVKAKQPNGIDKIFGDAVEDCGYRTLEVVSGDRRLLFEQADAPATPTGSVVTGQSAAASPSQAAQVDAAKAPEAGSHAAQPPAPSRRRPDRTESENPRPDRTRRLQLQHLQQSLVSPLPQQQHHHHQQQLRQQHDYQPLHEVHNEPQQHPQAHAQPLAAADQEAQPLPQTGSKGGRTAGTGSNHRRRQAPASSPAAVQAAERLDAAAALLHLSAPELRRYRGFCSELRALDGLGPAALAALGTVLVDLFGLAPPQLRAVLLRQPHVMRVPAAALARRGAALAMELQLPPPPAPGGGGPLADIVATAPDVLLRKTEYGGTCDALAAALGLPPRDALALLRREPQLLRHPPGFFPRAVAQLTEQLGLPSEAAAALAAAEPQLLAVSPGVLRSNGGMLRAALQLTPGQLADLVVQSPALLVRSPGELRAAVRRLTAVLSASAPWRAALPRLLASPRNLAVALSFGSDRYDRLEYLAGTGRDRTMGFKEGLSLSEEDFREVFPEYKYNVWRQGLPPQPPPPQPPPPPPPPLGHPHSHAHAHARPRPHARSAEQARGRPQARG